MSSTFGLRAARMSTSTLAISYYDNRLIAAHALTETLLSLSRREHPRVGERLNLETYLALRHVVLAPRNSAVTMMI